MSLLQTIEADFKKILAFIPFVTTAVEVADPTDAAAIAAATSVAKDAAISQSIIAALQPTVAAVQATFSGTLKHDELVAGVTAAITASSTQLSDMGVLTATTADHVAAAANLVNAAVAISGLAAPSA